MKKLLATLLALVMALGCFSALGEGFDGLEGLEGLEGLDALGSLFTDSALVPSVNVSLSVDADFVTAYAAMMDQPGTTTYADLAKAALGILEKLSITAVIGGDFDRIVLTADGAELATIDCVMDGENIALISSLFPNYALSVSMEQLKAMIEMYSSSALDELGITQEQAVEMAQELVTGAMPYLEDVIAFASSIEPKLVEETENGTHTVCVINTHHIATLLKNELTRLRTDEAMKPYGKMFMDKVMSKDETCDWYIQKGFGVAERMLKEKAKDLATIELWAAEEGITAYIYAENLLFSFTYSMDEEGGAVTATFIVNNEPLASVDAWEAKYDAIQAGESEDCTMIEIGALISASEAGEPTVFFGLEVIADGQDILISGLVQTSGELYTEDFTGLFMLGVNPGLTANDLVTLAGALTFVEAPEAPSLEGKTVIDVLTMDEETQQALLNDIMGFGLPGLLAVAQQVMPDEIAVILQMAMPAQPESIE